MSYDTFLNINIFKLWGTTLPGIRKNWNDYGNLIRDEKKVNVVSNSIAKC